MSPVEHYCEYYLKEKEGYPKTFEECCGILSLVPESELMCSYRHAEMENFYKLLICRDAYWKIDNYNPEFKGEIYYYISLRSDLKPILWLTNQGVPMFLSFREPSARDAFYENFKELIESAKELL